MNMTEALAHSNNLYFEEMGREPALSASATTPPNLAWANWPGTTSPVSNWAPIPTANCRQ